MHLARRVEEHHAKLSAAKVTKRAESYPSEVVALIQAHHHIHVLPAVSDIPHTFLDPPLKVDIALVSKALRSLLSMSSEER